eukprot:3966010-Amphidinium_carterae.1
MLLSGILCCHVLACYCGSIALLVQRTPRHFPRKIQSSRMPMGRSLDISRQPVRAGSRAV